MSSFIAKGQQATFTNNFFSGQEGLTIYNINSITQDKYGIIWLGTQDGISAFDGRSFEYFNKYSSRPIQGNDVKNIIYDSINNIIWAAFSYGGISAIDCRTHTVTANLSAANNSALAKNSLISSISLSKENDLIIAASGSCLLYNYTTAKTEYLFTPGMISRTDCNVPTVADDKNYYYVFVDGYGIVCISKASKKITQTIQNKTLANSNFIRSSAVADNKIFFGTNEWIAYIDAQLQYHELLSSNEQLTTFAIDSKKNIWVAKKNSIEVAATPYTSFSPIRFLNNSERDFAQFYLAIFFDKKNNAWIGSSEGLVYSNLSAPVFTKFESQPSHNKSLVHLYNILPVKDDIIVNDINGLKSVNARTGAISYIDTSNFPYYIFQTPRKEIIYNNEKGFSFIKGKNLDHNTIFNTYPELKTLNGRLISSHAVMNDSLIILGGEDKKGIIIWDIARHTVSETMFNKADGWEDNVVNMVYPYNSETIIVCQDKCLTTYNIRSKQKTRTMLSAKISGETARLYFDIVKYKNTFLIACYGYGIFITDPDFNVIRIINTANGLSNNGVYRIMIDSLGFAWISSNNGLTRINLQNYSCVNYYEKDGLASRSFEEMSAANAGNEFYFGGLNGFTKVSPENIRTDSTIPTLYFTNYRIKSGNTDTAFINIDIGKLTIPSDALQSTIYFSTLSYSNKETKFLYRIKEQNESWINNDNQNFITLIGLSPGTYHLQVKAANEDGIWSEPKELTLVFLPKWYQTWWFRLLIILTAAGIVYALYRYRVGQIKKQHEIRKNIATDLHDDLGSTLNSVKVFTNLAISGVKQEESLQQIKDNLNAATMGLRDMIWVLDDSLDTVDELVTRLKQYALPVAGASNIEVAIQSGSDVNTRKLSKEEKRNLFLICKEAINNSIKYADASRITVDIQPYGKKIAITIRDNGKGFDPELAKKGYGLKNMQYRAGQVNFSVSLSAAPAQGTAVHITPL